MSRFAWMNTTDWMLALAFVLLLVASFVWSYREWEREQREREWILRRIETLEVEANTRDQPR